MPDAAKKSLWDDLFDKVIEQVTPSMVAEGFVDTAASIVLQQIMGPKDWEREVTGQLKTIPR